MTMANGMCRRGIKANIFEKKENYKPYPNFRITIDEMGSNALEKILEPSTFQEIKSSSIITNKKVSYVSTKDLTNLYTIKTSKKEALVISSSKLMKILSSKIPSNYVNYSKNFTRFKDNGKAKITTFFEDDTTIETDFLIGCDGVHSDVRKKVTSEEITDLGYRFVEGVFTSSSNNNRKIDNLLLGSPIVAVGSTGYALSVYQIEEENQMKTRWKLSFLDESYQGKIEKKSLSKEKSILKQFCLENMENWDSNLLEIVDQTPLDQIEIPEKFVHHLPKKLTKKVFLMGESLYSIFPFEYENENFYFEDINQFFQTIEKTDLSNLSSLQNLIKNYSMDTLHRVGPKVFSYETSIEKVHSKFLRCMIRNFAWSIKNKNHSNNNNNNNNNNEIHDDTNKDK